MGDYSNLTFTVPLPPKALLKYLDEAFRQYSGSHWHYDETVTEAEIRLGANDVSVGSVDQLSSDMDTLRDETQEVDCPDCNGTTQITNESNEWVGCGRCIANGTINVRADLAYTVHEDPLYEWMGSLVAYAPGLPLFSSECDADGSPVVSTSTVVALVNKATDLDELKARVNTLGGKAVLEAQDNVKLVMEVEEIDGLRVEVYRHQVVA